ncbi:hypothetical protein NDU88_003158 [Pleurodeles waltl]|uniref:Uncharacterized protein n=1 Tax=Pleurodeles waltl TaxID=8319 RepID=A0AAV7KXP4_PLEWA|nr:hypothetical protein NDU88_003158 [Pleurodeles waltl]
MNRAVRWYTRMHSADPLLLLPVWDFTVRLFLHAPHLVLSGPKRLSQSAQSLPALPHCSPGYVRAHSLVGPHSASPHREWAPVTSRPPSSRRSSSGPSWPTPLATHSTLCVVTASERGAHHPQPSSGAFKRHRGCRRSPDVVFGCPIQSAARSGSGAPEKRFY